MPCSGPNCPNAEDEGEKAFNEIMVELEKKHGFPSAEELKDPKERIFYHSYVESRERLRKAFRDLFLSEACDTW